RWTDRRGDRRRGGGGHGRCVGQRWRAVSGGVSARVRTIFHDEARGYRAWAFHRKAHRGRASRPHHDASARRGRDDRARRVAEGCARDVTMRDAATPADGRQNNYNSLLYKSLPFSQGMAAKLPTLVDAMSLHLPEE